VPLSLKRQLITLGLGGAGLEPPLSRGPFCTHRKGEPFDCSCHASLFHDWPAATGVIAQGSPAWPFQVTVATFQKDP